MSALASVFTGFISWLPFEPGEVPDEEVDVTATSEEEARLKIQAELDRDYEPGAVIREIVERRR